MSHADSACYLEATDGTVQDWNSIAQRIDGRSNKDCRKRYYNGIVSGGLRKNSTEAHGAPKRLASTTEQYPLTPIDHEQQNMQLLVAVRTHGTSWKDIQTLHLPSRSANNVKNQYSVLKRHTLEVPSDAPPCCPTGTGSRPKTSQNTSRAPTDGADPLNQFTNENNPDFDPSHQPNHDATQSYSFPPLHGDDPFHPFEADVLSHTVDTNLMNHNCFSGSLDPDPDIDAFSVDLNLDHDYNLDTFDFQMTDAVDNQFSHTEPPPSDNETSAPTTAHHRNHQQHRSSGAQWPPPFLDLQHPPQKQQQQEQQTSTLNPTPPSDPSTPNWQTTIRFSSADPTTVSTVIGVLAKSQAKFVYETH
ncbi:MAG: hypothetical protein Q9213_003791 [Squamulea squamosa]